MKTLAKVIFYLFGIILAGGLCMPLMAFWVSDNGEDFYRQFDPFGNSVFMFIAGLWVATVAIHNTTKK